MEVHRAELAPSRAQALPSQREPGRVEQYLVLYKVATANCHGDFLALECTQGNYLTTNGD